MIYKIFLFWLGKLNTMSKMLSIFDGIFKNYPLTLFFMELPKHYNPQEAERKWQQYWDKEEIYKFAEGSKAKIYSVDTPPPTVSGAMHMGHAFSYSQCDFIVRYRRMKGENIFYPFGFDDNGLATERFVEKRAGKRATDMPRHEFIKLCLEQTQDIEEQMVKSWQSLGLSCEWGRNYRTIDEFSIRTSQLSFVEMYRKGRAYQHEAPTIWCPECSTAIAQVELEDKELKSYFTDVNFGLENGGKLAIGTTRPEYIPACVAIMVHPEDPRYKGIIGKKAAVPLFNYEVPIIADERADPEKGTGVVMCCTFGDQTDAEWWKAYKLPLRIVITPNGRLTELAGKYSGMPIKDARKKILEDLKNAGHIVMQKEISHIVNVHERCGTEIEFLVTKQWFVRYLDLREKFLEFGNKLSWHPKHMKSRYDGWIRGLQWDWCISRQRYFGVPFPVWYCKKCSAATVADDDELPVDPLQKNPKKACRCGSKEFIPEKDVLDTWATSSLTPYIALRWKDNNKLFEKLFPMSLRPQAHDIISFWLFNTVVKGYFHNNDIPWENVMISGWALDERGKKMSKSKGNVIEPSDMISKYCADALRFWASSSKLGDDLWFSEKEFIAGQRTITKLWNASKFAIMNLEDYDHKKHELGMIDKWLFSKLNKVIKASTEELENYDYVRLRLDTEKLFWQTFCDNYLEIAKYRLYDKENKTRKAAQYALYNVLFNILKLFAPIMPHITEEIYHLYFKEHEKKKSIHITEWPKCNEELINEEIEKAGDLAIEVISAVRKYKSENKLALNEKIHKLTIECSKEEEDKIEKFVQDIKAVMKISEVEFGNADIQIERTDVKIRVEK